MRTLPILFGLLVVSALARGDGGCATTEPTATIETPVATYYLLNEVCQPDCLFSVWIYEETNGEPGLQHGDDGIPEGCGLRASTQGLG